MSIQSQALKFGATILQNLPEVPEDIMQRWIEKPKTLRKVLTEALLPSNQNPKWVEKNGVISFEITSTGLTGQQWIEYFEKKWIKISQWARYLLLSPDFKPTNGLKSRIEVLKGSLFIDDNDRTTKKICTMAENRKLTKPNAEAACLVRDMFTDKELEEMDLYWIVVFHKPIKDFDGGPGLLSAGRRDDGSWLGAYGDRSDDGWRRGRGFAFATSIS